MSQKRSKNRFMQDIGLCKPLCAAMILCSWLILSPTTAKAADDVAITQAVDQQSTVKGTVVDINGEPYCILMIFFLKCRVSEWKHGID